MYYMANKNVFKAIMVVSYLLLFSNSIDSGTVASCISDKRFDATKDQDS